MQDEVTVRLKFGDDEVALGFRRAVRDVIANREALELRKDLIGAREVRREQEAIDPLCGIPRAAMPAHLHQPWPDPFRRCIDGDGMRCHRHRVSDQFIASQTATAFGLCGAIVASEPLQRQIAGNGAARGRITHLACQLAHLRDRRRVDWANRAACRYQMNSSCAPAVFSMKSVALMIPSTLS